MSADPVCGLILSEREAAAASFYNGRIYLFCSGEHRDLFNADPDLVKAIHKETGASILCDREPERLIDRVVDHYVNVHFQRPSVFMRDGREGGPRVVG